MLERLADIIRPLLAENRQGFEANEAMMSIMGCGADELAEILTALGYRAQQLDAAPPVAPPTLLPAMMRSHEARRSCGGAKHMAALRRRHPSTGRSGFAC